MHITLYIYIYNHFPACSILFDHVWCSPAFPRRWHTSFFLSAKCTRPWAKGNIETDTKHNKKHAVMETFYNYFRLFSTFSSKHGISTIFNCTVMETKKSQLKIVEIPCRNHHRRSIQAETGAFLSINGKWFPYHRIDVFTGSRKPQRNPTPLRLSHIHRFV